MTPTDKFLTQLAVGTAGIVAVFVTAWTGTLSPDGANTTIASLIVALGLAGMWTLANAATPNSDALAHLLIGAELLAAIVALASHHVLTSAQLQTFIAMLIVGGSLGGGAIVGQSSYAAALRELAAPKADPVLPATDQPTPAPTPGPIPVPTAEEAS